MTMLNASVAVVAGLALLIWSAERFVAGSAAAARHFGMPPLLIGMVVIGFGTSAPEMVVSAIAASQGNPGLALGNAYGSNIANIGLILGLTALVSPIAVPAQAPRRELPALAAATLLAAWQLWDGAVTRLDAIVLLGVFAALMGWTIWQNARQARTDALASASDRELEVPSLPLGAALRWLVIGLILLILSSRLLVWGAVEIAHGLGVGDLVIGLTIVAIGTSLPELASSLVAARKREHDLALGNIIGSNLFNTLAVVGIAGAIHPMTVGPEVLTRDVLTMALLTLALFVIGVGWRGPGRIDRVDGALLLCAYLGYTGYLAFGVLYPRG